MANTTAVYARIDSELKKDAENILSQLGITPTSAIQMLYSQIVLTRGLPLDLHIPSAKPTAIGDMNRVELDVELSKGLESLKTGKTYTVDDVDEVLSKDFKIWVNHIRWFTQLKLLMIYAKFMLILLMNY